MTVFWWNNIGGPKEVSSGHTIQCGWHSGPESSFTVSRSEKLHVWPGGSRHGTHLESWTRPSRPCCSKHCSISDTWREGCKPCTQPWRLRERVLRAPPAPHSPQVDVTRSNTGRRVFSRKRRLVIRCLCLGGLHVRGPAPSAQDKRTGPWRTELKGEPTAVSVGLS